MFNPLLQYAINSTPTQLEINDPASLTIVANNQNPDPGANPVLVKQIAIGIPLGGNANQLTLTPPTVTGPADWSPPALSAQGDLQIYTFTPNAGAGEVGGEGLVFQISAFTANDQFGCATLRVTQDTEQGTQKVHLPVVKAPDGWGTAFLKANPPIIQAGQSTTLSWAGPYGATYTISYLDGYGHTVTLPLEGQPAFAAIGSYPASGEPELVLTQTTTFTLNVSLSLGDQPPLLQTQQANVTVYPA